MSKKDLFTAGIFLISFLSLLLVSFNAMLNPLRNDIVRIEKTLKSEMTTLKSDMTELKSELKSDMRSLKAELKSDIREIRTFILMGRQMGKTNRPSVKRKPSRVE